MPIADLNCYLWDIERNNNTMNTTSFNIFVWDINIFVWDIEKKIVPSILLHPTKWYYRWDATDLGTPWTPGPLCTRALAADRARGRPQGQPAVASRASNHSAISVAPPPRET